MTVTVFVIILQTGHLLGGGTAFTGSSGRWGYVGYETKERCEEVRKDLPWYIANGSFCHPVDVHPQ